MTGTFETIDGQEINPKLDRGLGMADCGAFMKDCAVGGFELLDDGTRAVAGGFDDCDAFVNNGLCVPVVVGRHKGGKEGEIDAERVFGHCSTSSNFFPEIIGGRLRQSC